MGQYAQKSSFANKFQQLRVQTRPEDEIKEVKEIDSIQELESKSS